MTYSEKSLSRQGIGAASDAGGSAHSARYLYRTADTKATVEGAGYWNSARNRLKKGDIVDVVSGVGGTPVLSTYAFTSVPATGNVVATAQGSAGFRMAAGQHATVAASDTVVTGLASVVAAVATLDSDPGDDPLTVSCSIGDQAGAPAAGSILIKTWKTDGSDPTPAAATTFSKKVNWIAWGS